MTLPDGPYAYRTANATAPIICEVVAGHVWEVGDQHMRPLSHYGGEFIPLVEAPREHSATMPPEATQTP